MTRKQAIFQAIEFLSQSAENQELCEKLQEIHDELPLTHWSEKAIFDAFDQYIIDHGHLPTRNAILNDKSIPTHSTVKNRFKMTLQEFYQKYYKDHIQKCNSRIYHRHSAEYWINNFKEQYVKQGYPTMNEYDNRRDENTPMSRHLVKICGLKNWNELLSYCGFELHGQNNNSTIILTRTVRLLPSSLHGDFNNLKNIEERRMSLEEEIRKSTLAH